MAIKTGSEFNTSYNINQHITHTIHLNVSTFQGESKSCLLILDKVQSNFRVAFLLQVGNDRLADELGIAHHVQHFIVLAADQCQLELVLSRVDAEHTRTTLTVQAVDAVSLDARHVDWQIQRSDNAVVTTTVTTRRVCRQHICLCCTQWLLQIWNSEEI